MNKPIQSAFGLLPLAFILGLCISADLAADQGATFALKSPAVKGPAETGFDSGLKSIGRIDAAFAAKPGEAGKHRSFPFSWSQLPAGTKAVALILDDPDARLVLASFGSKDLSFLHWIATDIDPEGGGLADNASAAGKGLTQGKNGAGIIGYLGPQPPADIPKGLNKPLIHIYRLKVYALSAPTGLAEGFSLADLEAAVKDKTLAVAQFNFSFSNK